MSLIKEFHQYRMVFSPDGMKVAGNLITDEIIKLWDIETKVEISQFRGHTDSVNSIAFSPDGRIIASCSDDNTIIVWDVTTQQQIVKISGFDHNHVNMVIFSPDGRQLAAGFDNGLCIIWDTSTYKRVLSLQYPELVDYVSSIIFSQNGRYIMLKNFHGGVYGMWENIPLIMREKIISQSKDILNRYIIVDLVNIVVGML